jgi:hypothetical protein
MRLSQRFFKIRTALLVSPFVLVALIIFAFSVFSEYFIQQDELVVASFTIDKKYFSSYNKTRFLKKEKNYKCFDIEVREQPTIIRLSESTHNDSWYEIHDNYSKGDTLIISYYENLLQDDIIYNPLELRINNNPIISIDDNKKQSLITYVILAAMTFLYLFFTYLALKTYTIEFLEEDKALYRENKWELAKRWLGN